MEQREFKYFGNMSDNGLNADAAPFAIKPNQWINSENIRTGSTDTGYTEQAEAIGGMIVKSPIQPSAIFLEIGSATDEDRNRFVYCLYCKIGDFHKIVCYDATADTTYDVLLSSQVEGGFGWDKNYLIHSCEVVDGFFVFTNDLNETRYINIDAGIKLNNPSYVTDTEPYTAPVMANLIKRPPIYRLSAAKATDGTYDNNFIKDDNFQFLYNFYYKDNQESVLSGYSQLAPANSSADTYNAIDVYLQFAQKIPDYANRVDICVKILSLNEIRIVKTYTRERDGAAIDDHNNGTTALGFRFYNDTNGELVNSVKANTSFDDVPIISKTLAVAKSRLILGDNTSGYDTPTESSLTAEATTVSSGFTGSFDVYEATCRYHDIGGLYYSYKAYYVNIPSLTPAGYYKMVNYVLTNVDILGYPPYPTLPAVPASVNISEIVFAGANSGAVEDGIHIPTDFFTLIDTGSNTTVTTTFNTIQVQKSDSARQVGIVFMDKEKRRCGVYTSDALKVNIPDRDFTFATFYTDISWALSNTSAVNEIPDWAYWYQIVITRNLTALNFVVSKAFDCTYVQKNTNGDLVFGNASFSVSPATYAIALDLRTLTNYGLGYSFNEGDIIKIYTSTATYKLPVLGQQGSYVLVQPLNIGTLNSSTNIVFELYTPYKPSINEPYFETGDMLAVSNPGTGSRAYSVTSGNISGDVYALQRKDKSNNNYNVEVMSPNDKIWQQWKTDTGWPNFIDTIGQQRLTREMRFSDVYRAGSKVNGLNKFQPLNREEVFLEGGDLNKLQLTSKVQQDGSVMLAICTNQTYSVYLGEQILYDAQGNPNVAKADKFIGDIRALRGSFGTRQPNTVIEFRGSVIWWDDINGMIIQYASNGLFPISNYNMVTYWKEFTDQFNSMTATQIEALGDRPFVFMQVDSRHNELLITVPRLLQDPPKGYLPDYPSTVYPFDIWDGRGKTLVYKLDETPNRWGGSQTFTTEGFTLFNNNLYSYKNGVLYLHNQPNNPNTFYGVTYPSRIMCVSNMEPASTKIYNNIAVRATTKPYFVYFYNNYPLQQSSELVDYAPTWRQSEGVWYATLFRNKLVPNATGFTTNGILTGDKLRSETMFVMLEWNVTKQNPLQLKFISLGFIISRGHKI